MVNAFLLPEDDRNQKYNLGQNIKITETIALKSRQQGSNQFSCALA